MSDLVMIAMVGEGDRCVLFKRLFQHPPDKTEGTKKPKNYWLFVRDPDGTHV